jgi:hypothetical protein
MDRNVKSIQDSGRVHGLVHGSIHGPEQGPIHGLSHGHGLIYGFITHHDTTPKKNSSATREMPSFTAMSTS